MRRVVELRRGKTVWHIDVADAESDEEAKEQALLHANGVKKPNSTRWLVRPSNGKPGWEVARILEQFPHEAEAEAAAAEPESREAVLRRIGEMRAELAVLEARVASE
jgi:hypothetical protein